MSCVLWILYYRNTAPPKFSGPPLSFHRYFSVMLADLSARYLKFIRNLSVLYRQILRTNRGHVEKSPVSA